LRLVRFSGGGMFSLRAGCGRAAGFLAVAATFKSRRAQAEACGDGFIEKAPI